MAEQKKPGRKRPRGGAQVRARKEKARSSARQHKVSVQHKPLPKDPITVTVERPVHGGAAVGKAGDGRTVFVRGSIPGETVRALITADHKHFLWADTVEVLEPSEHRVAHVWPEPAEVGSAALDLGHVEPEYQREWKSQVLADQMRRVGGQEVAARIAELYPTGVRVQQVGDGRALGVRTRVQLSAGGDGQLGMRPYRDDAVILVEEIPIAVPALQDISRLDPTELGSKWKDIWGAGERVSLEAPTNSAALIVTEQGAFDLETAEPIDGASVWAVQVGSTERLFQVRPGGFWQTHQEAPAALAEAVLDAARVSPRETVVELYSGAGLFSRFLADAVGPAGLLLTLEGDPGAVEDAGKNLEDAIEDDFVVVFEGNVDRKSIAELFVEAKEHVDTVVLDPPRKGAGKDVIDAIGETDARRVVLVSCDPASGARDIRDLLACGFTLQTLVALDLFPGTHHFETVAELQR